MRAVILAAGIGSRLRPLTDTKPKALVRVAGKALLDYQLDAYRAANVDEVCIVTGYRSEAIYDHCKKIRDLKILLVENDDFEHTNNMYSLHLVRDFWVGRDFLLNNADLAIEAGIVTELVNNPFSDAVAVDVGAYNREAMKISVRSDGSICSIAKTLRPLESLGCSIDYYKFSASASHILDREIASVIHDEDSYQWTEVAIDRLAGSHTIDLRVVDIGGKRWTEVDDYQDLMTAERLFAALDFTFPDTEIAFVDLDGTLFIGDTFLPGAEDFVCYLRSRGVRVFFLSNNSSRSKADYVRRLTSAGVDAEEKDVVLSTDGLVEYLRDTRHENVFVLGTEALRQQVATAGISTSGGKPSAVVVGYDTELTYDKLAEACRRLHEGADLVATHADAVCPTEAGPVPDAGILTQVLTATSGKPPVRVFGKPDPAMVSHLLGNIAGHQILVVGDRLYTDMEFAQNLGAKSLLVLSGETNREDIENLEPYPSGVITSVAVFAGSGERAAQACV